MDNLDRDRLCRRHGFTYRLWWDRNLEAWRAYLRSPLPGGEFSQLDAEPMPTKTQGEQWLNERLTQELQARSIPLPLL